MDHSLNVAAMALTPTQNGLARHSLTACRVMFALAESIGGRGREVRKRGSMSALPYIPLFVADYLADTSHLSTIEHGAYLLLIMNYWQRGEALPSSDVALARIARLSGKEWSKIKPQIAPFFSAVDGSWHHGRIDAELAKVRTKSEACAKAGQASASAKAQRKRNGRSTDVEQAPNHTDTDTDTETDTKEERENARAQGDPKHWEEVQGYLRDKTDSLTDWEVEFLHSIKWAETLTKPQAASLKAIAGKLQPSETSGKTVFIVKNGSPEFAAWIAYKKGQGLKTAFMESLREMTVPSLLPPAAADAA